MNLPVKADQRRDALIEVGRQCSADRDERKTYHAALRSWYARGTESEARARYMKIKADVRQSAAYLFQSEAVRFGVSLPPRYGDQFSEQLKVTTEELHRLWHGTRAGLTVAAGVKWAHVYPTMIWKAVPSAGEAVLTVVPDPGDVGVFESDRPFQGQEALIHFFYLTLPAFERLVKDHPREHDLIDIATMESEIGAGADEPTAPTIERIAVASTGGDVFTQAGVGAFTRGSAGEPQSRVEAPRILCAELWVVDDRIHDWRVVTCLAPSGYLRAVIWDRRTPILSGMHPFVALTLDEALDYTWGFSAVDDQSGLQEWREIKMDQIDQLFTLQLKPPIVMGGFGGLSDERAKRLRTPNGVLTTSIPNPSVNRLAPTMPPEAFGFINSIDRMSADVFGLPILANPGGGDEGGGLRAGNQVGVLATLASARIRESAMRVEYACSECATLMLRLHRELSPEPLTMPDGRRFLLKHIPREIEAEVASHSASPLYAASIGDKFDRALKAGAISRVSYLEGLDLPMANVLKAEARRLEEAAAKRSERLLAIQEMKAERGRSR